MVSLYSCYLKCGTQAINICSVWELARNSDPRSHPSPPILHFNKISRWFLQTSSSETHYPEWTKIYVSSGLFYLYILLYLSIYIFFSDLVHEGDLSAMYVTQTSHRVPWLIWPIWLARRSPLPPSLLYLCPSQAVHFIEDNFGSLVKVLWVTVLPYKNFQTKNKYSNIYPKHKKYI